MATWKVAAMCRVDGAIGIFGERLELTVEAEKLTDAIDAAIALIRERGFEPGAEISLSNVSK